MTAEPPGSEFRSYDGTRLSYRSLGTGPVLVCLPGGPGRASAYLEDLAGLDETNTLVMLDSRGTGASAIPADETSYAAESLVRDVEALRVHLGQERLRLLGHSAGGKVAQLWAAAHPEELDRLVLVTTYLGVEGHAEHRDAVMALRSAEPWYAAAREAADGLPYARDAERQRIERSLRPFWYGRWSAREAEHAASADGQVSPRASSRFVVATSLADQRAGLGSLHAPVLVLAGALDALTPPSTSRELAEAIPTAQYVELVGAGHFPWVDQPAAFAAAVVPFLAA